MTQFIYTSVDLIKRKTKHIGCNHIIIFVLIIFLIYCYSIIIKQSRMIKAQDRVIYKIKY